MKIPMPKAYWGVLYQAGLAKKVRIEKVAKEAVEPLAAKLRIPKHTTAEWLGCYDSFFIPGQPELDKINYFLGLYQVIYNSSDKLAGVFLLGNMAHHQLSLREMGRLSLTLFDVIPQEDVKGLFWLAVEKAAQVASILSIFPCYRTLQGNISPRLMIEYGITAKDPNIYSFAYGEDFSNFGKYRIYIQKVFFPYFWEMLLFGGIELSYRGPLHMSLAEGEEVVYSFSYFGKTRIQHILQIGETFLERMRRQNESKAHIIWPDLDLKSLDSLSYFL